MALVAGSSSCFQLLWDSFYLLIAPFIKYFYNTIHLRSGSSDEIRTNNILICLFKRPENTKSLKITIV